MKNKLMIIIFILFVVIVLFLIYRFFFLRKIYSTHRSLNSFDFFYTNGNMIYSSTKYELHKVEDGYVVGYKPHGIPDEDIMEKEVGNEFVLKIESILEKYEVSEWDGFDKSDSNVLDGDSFSLMIHFDDKSSISSLGYMKYPKNYKDFLEEIKNIFEEEFSNMSQDSITVLLSGQKYEMELAGNETSKQFQNMLPLTISMKEFNGNEKYASLKKSLTRDDSVPKGIHKGDVYLYQGDTLVVFYEDFSTSYSYTKIGHIKNFPILNQEDIKITFE